MSIRASTLNATRLAPFIEQVGGDAKGKQQALTDRSVREGEEGVDHGASSEVKGDPTK